MSATSARNGTPLAGVPPGPDLEVGSCQTSISHVLQPPTDSFIQVTTRANLRSPGSRSAPDRRLEESTSAVATSKATDAVGPSALPANGREAATARLGEWRAALMAWARGHKVQLGVAAVVFLLLLAAALGIAGGLGAFKRHDHSAERERQKLLAQLQKGPMVLVLNFLDEHATLAARIPPEIRAFIQQVDFLSMGGIHLLKFGDPAALLEALQHLRADAGVNYVYIDRYHKLRRRSGTDVETAQKQMRADAQQLREAMVEQLQQAPLSTDQISLDDVSGSGSGRRHQRRLQSNDPLFLDQWFLQDSYTYSSRVEGAWSVTQGSKSVVVAVIDSGVDYNHPDLKDSIWRNPKEFSGMAKVDDDKNGFIDDKIGWNFGCNNNDPDDDPSFRYGGHGTNVAGLIAAAANNRMGGSGIAPSVQIMPIRVMSCDGLYSVTTSNLLKAIQYAASNGAHIISCSFGPDYFPDLHQQPADAGCRTCLQASCATWDESNGHQMCDRPWDKGIALPTAVPVTDARYSLIKEMASFTDLLKGLDKQGVLVVASAGNEGLDMDVLKKLNYPYWPCLAQSANVVCVAAEDMKGAPALFQDWGATNRGKATVHIVAPGVNMLSTYPVDLSVSASKAYMAYYGTSQATPLISATAALLLSTYGTATGSFTGHSALLKRHVLSSAAKSAVPTVSGRLDATAAVSSLLTELGVPRLMNTAMVSSQGAAQLDGLQEEYYRNPTPLAFTAVKSMVLLSVSCRAALFPFRSFKVKAPGTVLRLTANLVIQAPQHYSIRITTSSPVAFTIAGSSLISPKSVTAGTLATFTASFVANNAGTFPLEILIYNPTNLFDFAVTPSSPSIATPTLTYSTTSYVPTKTSRTSKPTFLIKYSLSATAPPASFLTAAAVPEAAAGAKILQVPALAYNKVGDFATALGITAALKVATGTISTTLVMPSTPGTKNFAFQVTCQSCMLLVNSKLALDAWEGAGPKQSGCIRMQSGSRVLLTIKFAVSSTPASSLTLLWGACMPGSNALVSITKLSPIPAGIMDSGPLL